MDLHSSKSQNVLWFVESLVRNENTYNIKGWVCSYSIKIDDLSLEDQELNVSFIERPDVLEFYSDCDKQNGGFEIEVKIEDINKRLYLKSNYAFYELGLLTKWLVYYSGYNNYNKDLVVVDNFYNNPDMIREYTMNNLIFEGSNYNKGRRSTERFILDGTKEQLEYILGREIINWNHPNYANGIFQYCTADQPIVYHVDAQTMAAVVFLTKDAPLDTGTAFFRSKFTGDYRFEVATLQNERYVRAFTGDYNNEVNFYDSTLHEKVDEVANVYNRLVIWDAKKIHAATKYFGDSIENARYFQLFFFDVI
jgi:hypothetical protein